MREGTPSAAFASFLAGAPVAEWRVPEQKQHVTKTGGVVSVSARMAGVSMWMASVELLRGRELWVVAPG
jgi:hypothetical protein